MAAAANRLADYQSGRGAGVITPDGCPVEVYTRLPAGEEPGLIHGAVPAGASILELGAGAGRVTHPLVALGHPVTAVDESAAMLEHVRGAATVQGAIETLDLGVRFDAVVLGSHLVNTPDPGQRAAFLAACARHVAPGGSVLIEQVSEAFFAGMAPTFVDHGTITARFRDVRRPAPGRLAMTIDYAADGGSWTQRLVCARFDLAELGAAGLGFAGLLTADGSWFRARPAVDRASSDGVTAAPAAGSGDDHDD